VDIDRYEDWWVVERLLKRRRVLFVVTGNVEVGLGHAHRTLALAHELVHHDVAFLCTADSALAHQVVSSHHFPSTLAPDRDLAAVVLREKPHLVVNDILDTDLGYVRKLKDAGLAVVNFEDAGPGAAEADLVINALYDEVRWPHVRTGIDYACLRDEFIHLPRSRESIAPEPRELLIAFGGTDEGNLTVRVLRAVAGNAHRRGMHVSVVTGPGYLHLTALVELAAELSEGLVELAHDTRCISLYMARADLAICSGGRTTLELASLAVPTIVLCQNERETTHIFAGAEQGFVNLGLHTRVPTEAIRKAFDELAGSHARRQDLSARMRALPLLKGKQRVVRLLLEQLEDDGSVS
jgi:spore coat polysaccharide biosynthesis predicted glycosyltransferase SpsG